MDILKILDDKSIGALQKREQLISGIESGIFGVDCIEEAAKTIDDKKVAIILEAMEDITRTRPELATLAWLEFAEKYLNSPASNAKREASRVAGNIAHLFPENLSVIIDKLLANTADPGTVIRWGSAYALAKIIVIAPFANSPLFDKLSEICSGEQENGVNNQYVKALKKAAKYRK